jgi:glycerol-3-phosphate dehydrogenase
VQRLPVLVPLYQRGIMRTEVFRLAFWIDRMLLPERDRRGEGDWTIPQGQVLSPEEVQERFPDVDRNGLAGGALWYDARIPDSQRLLMQVLRGACRLDATALNYMTANGLLTNGGRVEGVRARDVEGGETYLYEAPTVINAAGPWGAEVASRFGGEGEWFRPQLCAWNVLFDRPAPSSCALGAAPPRTGAQHFFIHPWKGRMLVGTGHAARTPSGPSPDPTREEMIDFLADLNSAFPTLELHHQEVLSVYSGALPATHEQTTQLSKTDRWIDHADRGGPEGLFSVQGTKFTAARSTAEQAMNQLFPSRSSTAVVDLFSYVRNQKSPPERGLYDYDWHPDPREEDWMGSLKDIAEEESAVHLDDLMFRRTSLGDNPERAIQLASRLCDLFDWDDERCGEEVARVAEAFSYTRSRYLTQSQDRF